MWKIKRSKNQIEFLKRKIEDLKPDINNSNSQYTENFNLNMKGYELAKTLAKKLEWYWDDSLIVFMYDENDFLEKLINTGKFYGKTDKQINGRPSSCHENSSNYYTQKKNEGNWNDNLFICTWYALSDDLLWREHTWIIENGKILETTVERLAYYWICLEGKELEDFLFFNWCF